MSVEYVDHMGSDLNVVNAARVSFAKIATEFTDKDVKLVNYLAKHNHWTPYAHAFVSLRIKAPIFVARQAVKHQVGLAWNEVSRRYVDDEPEFYVPPSWRARPDGSIKQGSSTQLITEINCEDGVENINETVAYVLKGNLILYNNMIKAGVAPEQARMVLPLNTMTEWIWSGSLAAFARVCRLRLDAHAQLEIQELAQGIKAIVEPLFPVSFAALMGE
jgi:thymidylate synthase (FAD)